MEEPKKERPISRLDDIGQEIWLYNQIQGDPSLLVQIAGQNHATIHEAYMAITRQLNLLLEEKKTLLRAKSSDSEERE